MSIITLVIPLALKLISMWLDKKSADAETKKAFLAFIDSINKAGIANVQIRVNTERDQLEDIKNQWGKE